MPLVNVMVNGRAYTIACDDGEEDHLRELAAHVDAKTREVLETVGQVGDLRLMLMAALLVADECHEANRRFEAQTQEKGERNGSRAELSEQLAQSESTAAEALDAAARRAEALVAALGQA